MTRRDAHNVESRADALSGAQCATYPGARWWSFDFHTHTPASQDTPWHRREGTPEALAPEAWLLRYMQARIDCVAVTDHNSGEWIDRLKNAYARMQAAPPEGFRELHLFPGVELSMQEGFHLLAIFDPSASGSDIVKLLGRVTYDGAWGDPKGCVQVTGQEAVRAVRNAGGIAIPAHVDIDPGLLRTEADAPAKTVLHSRIVEAMLDQRDILAMEVIDRDAPMPALYSDRRLRWTRVLGSDCHKFNPGYAHPPGSRFTWVKFARPSLEGLKLALLDGDGFSVRRSDEPAFDPGALPTHFIEAIEIADARFMGRGQPAWFGFNPGFNAVIGGRGTGKSTLIHALRLAYRRDDELKGLGEPDEAFRRFAVVGKGTAPGGLTDQTAITMTVMRDGIRYRLRWEKAAVTVEEERCGDWQASTSQSVDARRFPVRLFSQGQIAALAANGNRHALLRVIDAAAGTDAARKTLDEAISTFMSLRARMRELAGKLAGRDAVQLQLDDVRRKLDRFEVSHHAEVLKAFQLANRQTRETARQLERADECATQLRELADKLLAEDLPDDLFDTVADADALIALRTVADAIAAACEQLGASANRLDATARDQRAALAQSVWQLGANAATQRYEALKRDLAEQGVTDPSEYGRLVQERHRLETDLQRLDAIRLQRDELAVQADATLAAVWSARRALSETRRVFLRETLGANPFVRMRLIPYNNLSADALERSLRTVLELTDDRFATDIHVAEADRKPASGLIGDLLRNADLFGGELDKAPIFEDELEQLQKRLASTCIGTGNYSVRFNNHLATAATKRPELIDRLLTWFPEDDLEVRYSRDGKSDEFAPIEQASAGQRAAAMLAFLLAHGSEPLVLDQPEDDLDNHLIYDLIVRQIRENKLHRQLVVVTHNPNIVVNGDAEMLFALDFIKGQCCIKQRGSMQDTAMRDEVRRIMEGGAEALERRYRRLGSRES